MASQGQLEFVHGGLVSPDEACTNYSDVLRNFEEGHEFLRSEFGIVPKIVWQLDPFGHSSGMADLFAEIGFEATFFARMNPREAKIRAAEQDLEFIWKPSFVRGGESVIQAYDHSSIFAHLLYEHYCLPAFSHLLNADSVVGAFENAKEDWD